MTTVDIPLEHTTELALQEKAKLKKSLRRFDMVFFTLCALVGLDTLGAVAAYGPQGFFWLVVMAATFVVPYMLIMSEVGSSFTEEGGPYEWVKLSFGRFQAGIAAVVYWASNPFWVGGSLAFIASAAWASTDLPGLGIDELGSFGDFAFKFLFIWFSIGVAIAAIEKGKWIPNAGAIARVLVLGFFTFTLVIYAAKNGVGGFAAGDMKPTLLVFFALTPLILFNYVGFELQNGAAEEMVNPQRDVPVSVLRSGILGVLLYTIPVLGILLVLPSDKITGIGGFVDAVRETFTVYGGAQSFLYGITVLGFIFTLMTSGAVWMIGADRVLAVSAYDGSFFPWFGVFNKKLGTPVRCNVLSGVVSTLFMVAAVFMLKSGSAADAFSVVLAMATSTTLLSYLWIFPAALKLRYTEPDVHRAYRVPGSGNGVMWGLVAIVTAWALLGSWVAVFPGTLEPLLGVDYDFRDTWGVSRVAFHTLTLGTLVVMFLVAIVGYLAGKTVRDRDVVVPIEETAPGPA
jgi:amino acid transporter